MATNQLSTEQILSAVNALSLPDLERVFRRVITVQAERKAHHLSARESELLLRINQGTPNELRERFNQLRVKREAGSITDEEYAELTTVYAKIEELHAERMTALGDLALLRGVPLDQLMKQLGISFPEYV